MSQRILSADQFRALMQSSRPVEKMEPTAVVHPAILRYETLNGGHARPTRLENLRHAHVPMPTKTEMS